MSWVTGKTDTIQPTKGNPASLLPPPYRPSAIGLQAFANYVTQPRDPFPIAPAPAAPDRTFPDAIVYTDQYPPADPVALTPISSSPVDQPIATDPVASADSQPVSDLIIPTTPDHPIPSPELTASPAFDTAEPTSDAQSAVPTTLPPPLSPGGTLLSEPDNSLSGGFGTRLRTARQAAGITTLRQFSAALSAVGLHRSAASLGNWERDRHRPPNRAQLLPILSFLASRSGIYSLTDINDLLWLLDWRDLNPTEIERYFPMLTAPVPTESHAAVPIDASPTQPITHPEATVRSTTTNPIPPPISRHDHLPSSYRDHLRDHPTFYVPTVAPDRASYPLPNYRLVELQSSTGSG